MQEHLQKYCNSCFKSLSSNFQHVSKNCSKLDIHVLRLNIKRIWALIDILEKHDPTLRKKKSIKQIDKIFKYAGNLRDLQVEIQLLKAFKNKKLLGIDKLVDIFDRQKKKGKKQFQSQLDKVNSFEIILINQRLNEIIETIDNTEVRKKYHLHTHELQIRLNNAINGIIDKRSLHDIRTLIKNILYSIALLKKAKQRVFIDKPLIDHLNKTQQELGKWHDLMVLNGKIKSLTKQYHLNTLQSIVNDKLEIKLSEIINLLLILYSLFHKKKGTEVPSLS